MSKMLAGFSLVVGCGVLIFPGVAGAKERTYLASISGSYTYSAESSYIGDEQIGCTITDQREVTYDTTFNSRLPVTITVTDEDPEAEGGIRILNGELPVRGDQKRVTQDTYIHQGANCSGTYPVDPVKCKTTGKGTLDLEPDTYPVFESGEYEVLVSDPTADILTVHGIFSGGTDCFGPLFLADNYVNRYFLPSAAGKQKRGLLLKPTRKMRRNGLTLKGSSERIESGTAGVEHDGTWSSGWKGKWKLDLALVE